MLFTRMLLAWVFQLCLYLTYNAKTETFTTLHVRRVKKKPLQVTHVLCVHVTRDLQRAVPLNLTVVLMPKTWNHVCLISFPYCDGKCTDVFEMGCSVKFPRPAYPLLETSRGAPTVQAYSCHSIGTCELQHCTCLEAGCHIFSGRASC
jgi:hypothetical protein